MREIRSYGSVRGALSNERPYRERQKDRNHRVFGWDLRTWRGACHRAAFRADLLAPRE